jgi:hypothetical protein
MCIRLMMVMGLLPVATCRTPSTLFLIIGSYNTIIFFNQAGRLDQSRAGEIFAIFRQIFSPYRP